MKSIDINKQPKARTFVVAYDYSYPDKPVLIVGEKNIWTKTIDVINAVSGKEATNLYNLLTKGGDSND